MCAREGNPRPLAVTATLTRGTFSLDLDFRVEPGEVIGLTGPIGSGKSSALHLLTGALRATVGSVSHGQTVWDQPANKAFVTDRSVAHLSQFFQNDLPEDLTGVEVVAQSVKKLNPDDRKPEETARVTLAALGLGDHVVDRLPWTFSGAEAQRTALARAVAPRPAVLLLDEPFGALDKRTGVAVRNWLQGWLATFDGCAILASTNTEHLEPLTDRFVSLDR